MHSSLSLLAPLRDLPAEGDDPEWSTNGGAPSATDLLRSYASLLNQAPPRFTIRSDGQVELPSASEEEAEPADSLGYLEVQASDAGPAFALTDTTTRVDLAKAIEGVRGFDAEDSFGQVVERLAKALEASARGLRGRPVPLVRWAATPDSAEADGEGRAVQFLGAWLVEDEDAFRSLQESGEVAVILEEAEIEGHGLREAAAALAVLGISLSLPSAAEAGLLDFLKGDSETRVETTSARSIAAKIDYAALENADRSATRIIVDVSKQRAYLIQGDTVLIDTPVSTARKGKYTPRGSFRITQRVETGKVSTIYGCALPYWMRLDGSAIGLHVGELPGYPASAGCIRLPSNIAPLIFHATSSGTSVQVMDQWQSASQPVLVASN